MGSLSLTVGAVSPRGARATLLKHAQIPRKPSLNAGGGAITPLVDRVFRLEEVCDALAYSESGRATGKVVIKVV